MNIIMPIVSYSVLLPDDCSVWCSNLFSAETLCTFLDMQDNRVTNNPIVSYTVTLPNGRYMPCKDMHSAEMLCDYINGLNAPAEPEKDADNSDKDYNQRVGSLVGRMPPGSTLTHNTSGSWKYRGTDGSEYGPHVNVRLALGILRKP